MEDAEIGPARLRLILRYRWQQREALLFGVGDRLPDRADRREQIGSVEVPLHWKQRQKLFGARGKLITEVVLTERQPDEQLQAGTHFLDARANRPHGQLSRLGSGWRGLHQLFERGEGFQPAWPAVVRAEIGRGLARETYCCDVALP